MYSWDNAQVVLVGNKCDLEQDRAITQERGQRLADQLGKLNVVSIRMYNVFNVLLLLYVCFFVMLCFLVCFNVVLYCFSKGSTDKNAFMGKNSGYINWK